MIIQKPSSRSALVPYSPASVDNLWRNGQENGCHGIAGISADGTYGWIAKGGALEVFDVKTGQRWAAWWFRPPLQDSTTVITAVCDFCQDTRFDRLLVATSADRSLFGGCICLFDISSSSVIKSIRLAHSVTALETLSAFGPDRCPTAVFSSHLQCFSGIVAVGTTYGHVYIIDVCLDDDRISNEQQASDVKFVKLSQTKSEILTERFECRPKGTHIGFELAEDAHGVGGVFNFRKPNGAASHEAPAKDVVVTCLHFVKRAGFLAVGFNFGCFQLWKLSAPVLEFSSRFDKDLPAIISFAYQEPEDDPKYFGYLWVVRGPLPTEPINSSMSYANLYQLGFSSKIWCDNYGFLLEDLHGIWVRFEHDLHTLPFTSLDSVGAGSRIITCRTLTDWRYKPPLTFPDNEQSVDESFSPDLNRCAFVWEAAPCSAGAMSCCFLAIFDMNLWYNAQIPNSVRDTTGAYDTCPYWSVYCLDELMQASSPERLLMVHIWYETMHPFKSCVCPTSEQLHKFLQPTSLAFKLSAVSESGIISASFLGLQKQILADIQSEGPELLRKPSTTYGFCVNVGLVAASSSRASVDKRASLLTLALDHSLVNFITSSVAYWASPELPLDTGDADSLRFLVDWAWQRVTATKENVDKLCECLYDWSGSALTGAELQTMHHNQTVCRHLVTIFEAINAYTSAPTDSGRLELAARLTVVQLIADYVDAVMWFHSVGLLPEHSEADDDIPDNEFAFPATKLTANYERLLVNLRHICSGLDDSGERLFIDKLVETEASETSQLSGGKMNFYPPASFRDLLNIYLLMNVTRRTKHIITLYVIHDLMNVSTDDDQQQRMEHRYASFCHSFGVTPSLAKFIRGIWLLDNSHFKEASTLLLDKSVQREISHWQHAAILRTFLYNGHERLALTFTKSTNVPTLTPEDIQLRLTVLLANRLTNEAVEYQRACRGYASCEQLMSHLIHTSIQTKTIGHLLHLSLMPEETEHLVSYLKNMPGSSQGHDLLVLYYLEQSKVIDAIRQEDCLKPSLSFPSSFAKTRKSLIDGYRRAMPSVLQRFDLCGKMPPVPMTTRREYDRPLPLSATICRGGQSTVSTRATLLNNILDKVNELTAFQAPARADASNIEVGRSTHVPFVSPSPFVPRSLAKTRSCAAKQEVVFPAVHDQSLTEVHGMTPLHKVLQSRLSAMHAANSSAALSLLRTPPVTRKFVSKQSTGKQETKVTKSALHVRHKELMASSMKSGGITWQDATVHLISPLSPMPGVAHTTELFPSSVTSPVAEARGTLTFADDVEDDEGSSGSAEEMEEETVDDEQKPASSSTSRSVVEPADGDDVIMEIDEDITVKITHNVATIKQISDNTVVIRSTAKEPCLLPSFSVLPSVTEPEILPSVLPDSSHQNAVGSDSLTSVVSCSSAGSVLTASSSGDVSLANVSSGTLESYPDAASKLKRPPMWESRLLEEAASVGRESRPVVEPCLTGTAAAAGTVSRLPYESEDVAVVAGQEDEVYEENTEEAGTGPTVAIDSEESPEIRQDTEAVVWFDTEVGVAAKIVDKGECNVGEVYLESNAAKESVIERVPLDTEAVQESKAKKIRLDADAMEIERSNVMEAQLDTEVEKEYRSAIEIAAREAEVSNRWLDTEVSAESGITPTLILQKSKPDAEADMELGGPPAAVLASEDAAELTSSSAEVTGLPTFGVAEEIPEQAQLPSSLEVAAELVSEVAAGAMEVEKVSESVLVRGSPRRDALNTEAGDLRPRRRSFSRSDVPLTPTRHSMRIQAKTESKVPAETESVTVEPPRTPTRRKTMDNKDLKEISMKIQANTESTVPAETELVTVEPPRTPTRRKTADHKDLNESVGTRTRRLSARFRTEDLREDEELVEKGGKAGESTPNRRKTADNKELNESIGTRVRRLSARLRTEDLRVDEETMEKGGKAVESTPEKAATKTRSPARKRRLSSESDLETKVSATNEKTPTKQPSRRRNSVSVTDRKEAESVHTTSRKSMTLQKESVTTSPPVLALTPTRRSSRLINAQENLLLDPQPAKSPARSPARASAKSPPAKSPPSKSPSRASTKSPAKSPPAKSPPAKSPAKSSASASAKSVAKSPPAKSPARSLQAKSSGKSSAVKPSTRSPGRSTQKAKLNVTVSSPGSDEVSAMAPLTDSADLSRVRRTLMQDDRMEVPFSATAAPQPEETAPEEFTQEPCFVFSAPPLPGDDHRLSIEPETVLDESVSANTDANNAVLITSEVFVFSPPRRRHGTASQSGSRSPSPQPGQRMEENPTDSQPSDVEAKVKAPAAKRPKRLKKLAEEDDSVALLTPPTPAEDASPSVRKTSRRSLASGKTTKRRTRSTARDLPWF